MYFKNIPLLLIMIICGNLASAQIYLSKEMPEVSKTWKENTFTSTESFRDNIAKAPEFTILSKILKDQNLSGTIDKNEMVTIFAFEDKSFSHLEKKQKDSLLANKKLLVSMVKYLTVPGRIDKHGLETEAEKHNGKFYLATLSGEKLGVVKSGDKLYVIDSEGRKAAITDTDFYHENGFFHIINGLIYPRLKE